MTTVLRFSNDDEGYVAWLERHPGGYVLNTYPHVTSAYLILHRASCRTVNRPLGPGRSWTYAYDKSCSDDRTELEAWAVRGTGKPAAPCGHCLKGAGSAARPVPPTRAGNASLGLRAPRPLNAPVAFEGTPVRITIQRTQAAAGTAPPLVIEGAQWLSETFFRSDPSAVGQNSYDAWIRETQLDPARRDRVSDGDVTAVNRTMAARTAHKKWAPVVDATDWSWLEAIDPTWDLFEMEAPTWEAARVPSRLKAAFDATKRPGLHLAVISKVLHIKRPRMFPVLDSVVIQQVGSTISNDVGTWVTAMEHVRAVGRSNLAALNQIREHLAARGMEDRSLVRILDGLLWVSSPGSGLFSHLSGWERVIRPRPQAADAPVSRATE
jgi:hypothetical protein